MPKIRFRKYMKGNEPLKSSGGLMLWEQDGAIVEVTETIHDEIIAKLDSLPEPASALTVEHLRKAKDWLKRD